MIRYKLSIVPLVAATALALPACKPPQTAPVPEATPAASPASVEVTPAASPSASPAAADATNQILAQLKQAGVDANVTQTPPADTKPIVLPDIVASVNGQQITKQQLEEIFNAAVQSSGTNLSELSNEQKLGAYNQLLQELIMDKLVAAASSKEKVTDADVDAEIAKIKKQFPDEKIFEAQLKEAGQTPEKLKENIRTMLQQQAWMKSQVKVADVTEAKAKEFYDSNKAEFEQPETVKASHILFMVAPDATEDVINKQKDAALKAAARAARGENFTALAKELSEEPGAKESGGDLGFFSKDRMVPEFATVAFAQKVGDVGEPVKTQFGWHIIKVTDKKAAGTVPFADVKDQIIGFMKSNEQRQAVQGVLNKLKESAKIETFLPTAG